MKTFLCSCPAVGGNAVEIRAADAGEAEVKFRRMVNGLNGPVKVEAAATNRDQANSDHTQELDAPKQKPAKRVKATKSRAARSGR